MHGSGGLGLVKWVCIIKIRPVDLSIISWYRDAFLRQIKIRVLTLNSAKKDKKTRFTET
jgi:hypothetical protein